MWDLHKTHQTACHCLSPTCICTPLPLFPSLFTQFPFTIFLLRHDLKQKKWTKKPSKTSSLSPDELSSSACPIPFFSSKPFLSFHLPLWKAFVSCGDRNDKHFLLYLSYTVNRWEKKVILLPPVLSVSRSLSLLWFKVGWNATQNAATIQYHKLCRDDKAATRDQKDWHVLLLQLSARCHDSEGRSAPGAH